MIRRLAFALLLSLSTAGAESLDSDAGPLPATQHAPQPGISPIGAFGLSALATAGPILTGISLVSFSNSPQGSNTVILASSGIILGPSMGEFAARAPVNGLIGMAVRGTGVALLTIGINRHFASLCGPDDECSGGDKGSGYTSAGLILMLGGTLYGLVDSPLAAVRHRQARPFHAGLTPVLRPEPDGVLPGAMAWIRF